MHAFLLGERTHNRECEICIITPRDMCTQFFAMPIEPILKQSLKNVCAARGKSTKHRKACESSVPDAVAPVDIPREAKSHPSPERVRQLFGGNIIKAQMDTIVHHPSASADTAAYFSRTHAPRPPCPIRYTRQINMIMY